MIFPNRISFAIAIFAISWSSPAAGQTRVDTLPCDNWLVRIAAGTPTFEERALLYQIDGCDRPDSVVTAARKQGVRILLAANDAHGADVAMR